MAKPTYEEARAAIYDDELRQQYVSTVDLGEARPYVHQVIYDPSEDLHLMATRMTFRAKLGFRGEMSDILVFPSAFGLYERETSFLSTLVDHEGFHAKQIYENPSAVIGTLRNFLSSLFHPKSLRRKKREAKIQALRNQLAVHQRGERLLSDSLIETLHRELRDLMRESLS